MVVGGDAGAARCRRIFERQDPVTRSFQWGKALWGLFRAVLDGPEQRLRVRIFIADSRSAMRHQHAKLSTTVSFDLPRLWATTLS